MIPKKRTKESHWCVGIESKNEEKVHPSYRPGEIGCPDLGELSGTVP